MLLKMIKRGRSVLVIGGQESQNFSKEVIRIEPTRIRVLMMARQEAGPVTR
jgi:hypothetical protein